jgi:Domain of unknown function (DUF4185)
MPGTELNQLGRILDRGTVQVSPLSLETATAEKLVDHWPGAPHWLTDMKLTYCVVPTVWGDQNFQMGAYLRRDGYVYAYGTTAGRGGTPFLSRVPENSVARSRDRRKPAPASRRRGSLRSPAL